MAAGVAAQSSLLLSPTTTRSFLPLRTPSSTRPYIASPSSSAVAATIRAKDQRFASFPVCISPSALPRSSSIGVVAGPGSASPAASPSSGSSGGEEGRLVEEIGGGGGGGEVFGPGGGGGGDGEEGEGGSEGEGDGGKKMAGLSMSQKLTLGYAALVGVGGLMGFMKSGSQKSLAAGGSSALLLYFIYTQLPVRPAFASALGLGLSAALMLVMGSRFKRSGKIFPAGVVSVVSFVMVGGYFHGILRSLHA